VNFLAAEEGWGRDTGPARLTVVLLLGRNLPWLPCGLTVQQVQDEARADWVAKEAVVQGRYEC
jgi:hypothetical protein